MITAASAAHSDDRARLLVIAAVQQRRVRCFELRAVLARRAKLSRRRVIAEAIADAEGGVHSLPERQWLALSRRYHLPPAARQRRVRPSSKVWYLDCDFDDYLVTVEINGIQHHEQRMAESDSARRNVLGIGGRLVITFSSYDVRDRGEWCIAIAAAALISRGWRPGPKSLARLRQAAEQVGVDLHVGNL